MAGEIHGIREQTYDNIVFGPGMAVKNLDVDLLEGGASGTAGASIASAIAAGTLYGATRGGHAFNVTPEIRQIQVDGQRGQIMGLRRKTSEEATLTVNFIELTPANLKDMIPGAVITVLGNGITRVAPGPLVLASYIGTLAITAEMGTRDQPIILLIRNAMSNGGMSISLADNDEGVPSITFTSHYNPAQPTQTPWSVYVPPASPS